MALQFITPYSVKIGVVGAGTMGSGIALACLLAGMPVTLVDVSAEMLERARAYVEGHLERKGISEQLQALTLSQSEAELGGAQLVIEAIPEELALKQQLFARLDQLCPPPAILATNTSTLAVTAIAAATQTPARVAGMHFFNPAPVLPLVEIVRGASTAETTLVSLTRLAEKLGKTPVVTRDTPGFIVNRVARPFYGEALRMLGEQVATHAEIDRIIRLGGGFKLGPFQLMDLIGIDINLKAMQSMYEQTFGEPRYRPHPIQVRMVQQNALGVKTGRGFYQYQDRAPVPELPPPRVSGGAGLVVATPGAWAPGLVGLCREAGYTCTNQPSDRFAKAVAGVVLASKSDGILRQVRKLDLELEADIPILCQCVDVTLTEIATWLRRPERLVGFDGLFFSAGRVATLVASPTLTPQARQQVETFTASLGRLPVWVADSPGLVLPRLVSMLANEAAFAVLEGVAEAEQVDLAMQLGVSYPQGPLTWAKHVGYTQILAVLDHLRQEYGEERYRAAPNLRRWARLELVSA